MDDMNLYLSSERHTVESIRTMKKSLEGKMLFDSLTSIRDANNKCWRSILITVFKGMSERVGGDCFDEI